MRRHTLAARNGFQHFRSVVQIAAGAALVWACEPDIGELEDPPVEASVAVAQFDPTNVVPQLQLIPTPTVLAQVPGTARLDYSAIRPAECELPSTVQCLEFVDAWPTSVLPTFQFSARLTDASVLQGFKLFEVTESGPVSVPLASVLQTERPVPNEACQTGNNGAGVTFSDQDVTNAWGPTPFDAQLVPMVDEIPQTPGPDLKPETTYIAVATTSLRAEPVATGGPERAVEPSALFFTLNVDSANAPVVTEDGFNFTIVDALLRSQVNDSVTDLVFGGVPPEDPESDEVFLAARNQSAQELFGLFQVVEGAVSPLLGATDGINSRNEAVIVTTWTTGREPTVFQYDPAATVFPEVITIPLPNNELLAEPDPETETGLRVNLTSTATLTSTLQALVDALNLLDGFGNTSPIVFPTTRPLSPESAAAQAFMIELADDGLPTGQTIGLTTSTTAPIDAGPQLILQPIAPLTPGHTYAVAVTSSVTDSDGFPVSAASTFNLLKDPNPFVDGEGALTASGQSLRALQCSTLDTTGQLATDEEILASATGLEPLRARSQSVFSIFENLSVNPVRREDMAVGFTYTTHTITPEVQAAKDNLPNYELIPGDAPVSAALPGALTSSTAITDAAGVATILCVPVCQLGGLTGVSTDECFDPLMPDQASLAVKNAPECVGLRDLYGNALGQARLHNLRIYDVLEGNPFLFQGNVSSTLLAGPRVTNAPFWVITPSTGSEWPVAVFQHGLGSSKEGALFIANTLALFGWATVAVDLPYHGDRASDLLDNATGQPCLDPINPDDVVCTPGTNDCLNGCDGTRDSSGSGYLTPNVFGNRGALQQSIIDHLTLLRALREQSDAGEVLEDLDGSRVTYIGHSLGGITGVNLASYVGPSELETAVFMAAGGDLLGQIILETVPSISAPLFAGLAETGFCDLIDPSNPGAGCQPTQLYQLFELVAQWVQEPGDPKATALGVQTMLGMTPNLGSERTLLQISQPDPVVPNAASETLRAVLYPDATQLDNYEVYDFSQDLNVPASQDGGCHSFFLLPLCGSCTTNINDSLCQTFGAQQQAAGFISSAGASIPPLTPPTLGTIDCTNPCN